MNQMSHLKRIAPLAVAALAVVAAACGGSSSNAAASSPSTNPAGAATAAGTSSQPPGVSGTVAALNGTTLEVQGSAGQTTVDITPSTVITQTVAATASDLAVGQCVSATGTKASSGVVAATNVTIDTITSSSGSCSGGFGGAAGGRGFFRGGGGAGGAGAGATGSTLSPAQRARFANLGVATGKVTTISGSTVDVQVPTPPSTTTTTGSKTTTRRPRISPSDSFTFSSSTTFTETKTATAAALAVNDCVTAFGTSDATGAVTASRLAIRPPVSGSCSTGFAGRFGGAASTPGA
jgi:hypothetical protein